MLLSLFVVCSAILPSVFGRSGTVICGRPADIVFVLDTSSSIWPVDFDKYVKPFVKNVSAMLDIGPSSSQSRVGVVTYSSHINHKFYLEDHLSWRSLERAIDDIPYVHGNTYTHHALQFMANKMFITENGARSYAPHIAIVVTDGLSTEPWLTKRAAEYARSRGIQLFAIGVGSEAKLDGELSDIGNDQRGNFTFHVKNVRALHTIKRTLALRTCVVTTPSPPTTTDLVKDKPDAAEYCGGKPADVYFLLDCSNSIWIHDFNKRMITFVRQMIKIFDIGPSKTRIGVITFSSHHKTITPLQRFTTRDSLLRSITPHNIKYCGGQTNTDAAIAYVRDHGFKTRPGVAHIMVVVTDGVSSNPARTRREAAVARRSGIYVFAVGVGQSVDTGELRDIASSPARQFMFMVSNFRALASIRDVLAIRTCKIQLPADQPLCLRGDIAFVFETKFKTAAQIQQLHQVISTFSDTLANSNVRVSVFTNPGTDVSSLQSQLRGTVDNTELYVSDMLRKLRYEHRGVAVVILDKNIREISAVIAQAKMAKAQGLRLVVVAVGAVWDRFAEETVSSPVSENLIKVKSYKDFSTAGLRTLSRRFSCR